MVNFFFSKAHVNHTYWKILMEDAFSLLRLSSTGLPLTLLVIFIMKPYPTSHLGLANKTSHNPSIPQCNTGWPSTWQSYVSCGIILPILRALFNGPLWVYCWLWRTETEYFSAVKPKTLTISGWEKHCFDGNMGGVNCVPWGTIVFVWIWVSCVVVKWLSAHTLQWDDVSAQNKCLVTCTLHPMSERLLAVIFI